jgi:hypothetical protein
MLIMNRIQIACKGLLTLSPLRATAIWFGLGLPIAQPVLATPNLSGTELPITPQMVNVQAITPPLLSQTTVAPAVPALPQPIPNPMAPVLTGIIDLATTDASLGVGYIRPMNHQNDRNAAAWLTEIALPLYSSANGPHWGWLIRGWLIPNDQPALAIGRDASFAMVGVEEGLLAFPVLEVKDENWLRIQYTPGGSAWAYRDHLTFGDRMLVFEPWDTSLTAGQRSEGALSTTGPIQFQRPESAQVLRSQPTLSRNVISLVSADSLIEPLEVNGDWVRVRVTRPVDGCQPLNGASTEEGWMRWRNDRGEVLLVNQRGSCQANR